MSEVYNIIYYIVSYIIGNTTGLFSVYSTYKQYEVMFHVATLLPFQVDDLQRVERKRHLGNDVVMLIFKEKGAVFDPQCISSQFNSNYYIPNFILILRYLYCCRTS